MEREKNSAPPPLGADFWDLFDFIWVRGLGHELHADGTSQSWTAIKLEIAFNDTPDKRSVENWQSRTHMPSPDNLRKLSALIADGDDALRKTWYEALLDARLAEKRKEKAKPAARRDQRPVPKARATTKISFVDLDVKE